MTRIRIFEWLIAAVLIVVAHGAAVSAWLLLAPKSSSGVVLPQIPVKEKPASTVESISLSVKIIGLEQEAPLVAAQPASAPKSSVGTGTSPGIVDKDTSQVPKAETSDEVVTTVVSAAPIKQIDTNAGPQPSGQNEVLPSSTAEIIKLADPEVEPEVEPEEAESDAGRSTIRDPVPVPKAKPASVYVAGQAPADDESATNDSGDNGTKIASAPPATPESTADSQAASAAQTTYYRVLIAELKNKRVYPSEARRDGKVGTVYLQIVVKNDGAISSYEILRSSGHAVLDEAAVNALREASPVAKFPDEIAEKELKFGVPIRFP